MRKPGPPPPPAKKTAADAEGRPAGGKPRLPKGSAPTKPRAKPPKLSTARKAGEDVSKAQAPGTPRSAGKAPAGDSSKSRPKAPPAVPMGNRTAKSAKSAPLRGGVPEAPQAKRSAAHVSGSGGGTAGNSTIRSSWLTRIRERSGSAQDSKHSNTTSNISQKVRPPSQATAASKSTQATRDEESYGERTGPFERHSSAEFEGEITAAFDKLESGAEELRGTAPKRVLPQKVARSNQASRKAKAVVPTSPTAPQLSEPAPKRKAPSPASPEASPEAVPKARPRKRTAQAFGIPKPSPPTSEASPAGAGKSRDKAAPVAPALDDLDLPEVKVQQQGPPMFPQGEEKGSAQNPSDQSFGTLDIEFSDLDQAGDDIGIGEPGDTLVEENLGAALPLPALDSQGGDIFEEPPTKPVSSSDLKRQTKAIVEQHTASASPDSGEILEQAEQARQDETTPQVFTTMNGTQEVPEALRAPASDDTGQHVEESTSLYRRSDLSDRVRSMVEARQKGEHAKAQPSKTSRSKWPVVVLVFVVLVGGVGFALKFTPYGLFGRFLIERYTGGYGNAQAVDRAIKEATSLFAQDSHAAAQDALKRLSRARASAGLNPKLLVQSLFFEAVYQLRFGANEGSAGRADTIARRLQERGIGASKAGSAFAVHLASKKRIKEATKALAAPDTYALPGAKALATGLVSLAGDAPSKAIKPFATAVPQFGNLARYGQALAAARLAQNNSNQSEEAANLLEALRQEAPNHVGATLLEARRLASDKPETPLGYNTVNSVLRSETGMSQKERRDALTLRAYLGLREGHAAQAVMDFEQSHQLRKSAVALTGAGSAYVAMGRYDEALARFQDAEELGSLAGAADQPFWAFFLPDDNATLVRIALGKSESFLGKGQIKDALKSIEDTEQTYPDKSAVALARARILIANKNLSEAETALRQAIARAPKSYLAYALLAELLTNTGRNKEARELLSEADGKAEASGRAYRQLGAYALKRGDLNSAASWYTRALGLNAEDQAALFGLAQVQEKAGRNDAARSTLDKLAAQNASYPGLFLARGRILESQGDRQGALGNYQKALSLSPESPEALERSVALKVALGKLNGVPEALKKLRELRPNSAQTAYLQGRVALEQGAYKEAKKALEKALKQEPKNALYSTLLGWADLETGDLVSALAHATKATELDPSDARAYWVLGRVYLEREAYKDAKLLFEKALLRDNNFTRGYVGIANAYEGLGRKREAIKEYESAVAKDATVGAYWFNLGRLRADVQRNREAHIALEKATELGAGETKPSWHAKAYKLLGDLDRKAGQTKTAKEHYQKYLDLTPKTDPQRAEVEKLLASL